MLIYEHMEQEKKISSNMDISFINSRSRLWFVCESCGKEVHRSGQHFWETYNGRLFCKKCKTMQTCLSKYGVDNPAKADAVKKKSSEKIRQAYKEKDIVSRRRQSNLKRYGVANAAQTEKAKEKRAKTMTERYGSVGCQLHSKQAAEKRKQTCLKRYGAETPFASKAVQDKIKNRHSWTSEDNPMHNEDSIERRRQTVLKKYGSEVLASKKIRGQIKKTMLEKYGAESMFSTDNFRSTIETSFYRKTGKELREFLARSRRSQYSIDDMHLDSSWEVAVWIWAKDNGHQIRRSDKKFVYSYDDHQYSYFPDFEIDGRTVEVKGDQFFKEGKMVNPYDHSQDGRFEAKHLCGLQNGVEFWTSKEMQPVLDFVDSRYTKDFLQLFKVEFPYPRLENSDYGLIRHFHKSLFKASKKGFLSPAEAWKDKSLVVESAMNRLLYVGRCRPEDVVRGFSIANIAPKVSVFKPKYAQELISKYLSDATEIFDPFSGFSGRMLACANLGKKYVGQDVNKDHVRESNEIIAYKHIEDLAQVRVQDILTDSCKEHDCLFTCPPYGGKEHWNESNDEVEKSCDEWIEICLQKYRCRKYLFVVDETKKYEDFIVEQKQNRSHFGTNYEKVVMI